MGLPELVTHRQRLDGETLRHLLFSLVHANGIWHPVR